MHQHRIIIVEDNESLRKEIEDHLTDDGFWVRGVEDGFELNLALSESPAEALLLDLNLPNEDGLEITKRVRKAYPNIGIVILSARVRSIDRQQGYEAGADVFITKPAKPDELTLVLNNLCRRIARPVSPHQWKFDPTQLTLTTPLSAKINLTLTECNFLKELILCGELLENHRITELFGEIDLPESVNKVRIEQLVSRLRQKIMLFSDGAPCIKAVRGKGYKLLLPLQMSHG
jgi:DNA-binding response OmpR family regulator